MVAETVLINTAGGIAGGDGLDVAVTLGAGARAVITTQAAERVYRAREDDPAATLETTISLGPDAALDWLPQELIVFDGARLRRRLSVTLDANARFTAVETIVFGRAASGETISRLDLSDRIEVRRQHALLLHDTTRIDDPLALAAPARLGPARATATIVHAAEDAATLIGPLRAVLGPASGASMPCDGLLVARLLAPAMDVLRLEVVAALDRLRAGAHPPRVWSL